MSDAVVEKLMAEITDLKAEAKNRRLEAKKYKTELETIRTERDTLATERDTFKTKAEAGPKDLTDRIAELEGSIRTRDHGDAWKAVGEFEVKGEDGKPKKYTLAKGASVEDVWGVLGYKAEGDKPEAGAITENLGKALQAKPFMFSEVQPPADAGKAAPGGATQPITTQRREAGPGAFGKGVNDSTTARSGGMSAPVFRDGIPGKI